MLPVSMTAVAPPALADSRLRVVWEGPQFVEFGLAVVNRELCRALARSSRIELTLLTPERGHNGPPPAETTAAPTGCQAQSGPRPVDVHVRQEWPPKFEAPAQGRWVMVQPWEFGSLPRSWIEPMNQRVDEVWVPSRYVRDCYIRSGVLPSRVVVVPYGVDPARFRPGVRPLWLPTDKRFAFLFVGGTLTRKGVDILLETYLAAFRPEDDVCLVIKDFGTGSFYRGQGLGEQIRGLRGDPRNAEILYLDATLPAELMPRLYAACDCLVHPYRGEGFGLPIAEAMACGLPVIVPDYGACLDFCDPSAAYLVPAVEVRLPDRRVGDMETVDRIRWAEVDREALARAMRAVVEQREQARQLGRRASAVIRRRFTWERAAELVLDRLGAVAAGPVRRRGQG